MSLTIAERLKSALSDIAQTSQKTARHTDEVKLLAVSKKKPASDVEEAYKCGQRAFGENYVQEAVEKIQQLAHLSDIEWHLIGPLQSNKCKIAAENFDWVQSVDRDKIAKRLNEYRNEDAKPLNICIQINANAEQSKSGVAMVEVMALAEQISQYPKLRLRGIMAIPEKTDDDRQLRHTFQQLNDCFLQLKARYPSVDTLSMGMSGDMQQAIACGSTMVRIGTAIFGARD